MPLLAWFAIAVGWLAIGTLLSMAKWTVFHDSTPAKTRSFRHALRVLFFPISATSGRGWEKRTTDYNSPPVANYKTRESYLCLNAVATPFALTYLVPGLFLILLYCVVQGIVMPTTAVTRGISIIWRRIFPKRENAKSPTQSAIKQLTDLRDNELVKQESHLLAQKNALDAQVSRLQRERGATEKRVELLATADDQFADAYRVTLGRIERLLRTKQQELTYTEKALGAIKETIARLSGIVELIEVSAYMDTIDPRMNDSSQQLLRDAYACVEACRAVIARAQSISIGVQADTADVDELARQVDAGWTANEKQIRENGKLLQRLAKIPEPESPRPVPRLVN